MFGAEIAAIGISLPPQIKGNAELAEEMGQRRNRLLAERLIRPDDPRLEQFECDPDWILQRTGINERRVASGETATSDLAVQAARATLNTDPLGGGSPNFIIVATVTPDHPMSPPTAALVQNELELGGQGSPLKELVVMDINVACSSFLNALLVGYSLIRSGLAYAGLVIGADVMSRTANRNDRAMYPLLGDGAVCFLLKQTSPTADQFSSNGFLFGADGSLADLIITPVGGSRRPFLRENPESLLDPLDQPTALRMRGRELFKVVVPLIVDKIIPAALKKAGLVLEDIDAIVFHQANLRIIEAVVARLGYRGLVPINIDRVGNTSSAAIPLCFAEASERGIIKKGMRVLLVTFGGGVTWGTVLLRL